MQRSHWLLAALIMGIGLCLLGLAALVALGPLVSSVFDNISIQNIQWSPDGEHLALAEGQIADSDYRYQLYVLNRDDDLWQVTERGTNIVDYDWSPDSTQIAFINNDKNDVLHWRIYIADVEARSVRELVADSSRSPALDWSPDGASLAYWSLSVPGMVLVDVEDGAARTVFQQQNLNYASEIAWSPEGDRLAFISGGAVYIISSDGALLTAILDEENRATGRLMWSGDAIQFDTANFAFEVDSSGGEMRLVGERPNILAGRISPDGELRAKSGCEDYMSLDIAPCDEIELLVINTDDDSLYYKVTEDNFNGGGALARNAILLTVVAFAFLFGGPALTIPWFWNRGGCFRQAVIGVLFGGLFVIVFFGLLILLG